MSGDCTSSSQNSNEIRKEVKSGKNHDAFSLLRKQRLGYPKNVILGYLNINSLRNKFESISELITGKFDIFLINETKLDASFPSNHFAMSGYKFVRKNRNKFGGGIAFYVNDQLPSRIMKIENPLDIEILNIEITIRKNNLLFETDFTTSLETIISKLSNSYEKINLMGDFNMTMSNPILSQFWICLHFHL